MAQHSDSDLDPIQPPATGLSRAFNHVVGGAIRLVPRPLRNRMGWWTWSDVLDPRGNYSRILTKADPLSAQSPVATLLRRGFTPPAKRNMWPKIFSSLHKVYNSDNYWNRLPFDELAAWTQVWKSHPDHEHRLHTTLVGIIGSGDVKACRLLLKQGANPLVHSTLVMGVLWSGQIKFEKSLAMWQEIVSYHPQMASNETWDDWAKSNNRAAVLSRGELEQWRLSSAPLPSPAAAMIFALQLVDDPELGYRRHQMKANMSALLWWKKMDLLPSGHGTELLSTWLSTARPGDTAEYQQAMEKWADILLTDSLPARPVHGPPLKNKFDDNSGEPSMPWSHWAMSGPFFENIPATVREKLFDEPDSWTARNSKGETVADVIERRIEETRSQSRDEGLGNLRYWCRAHVVRDQLTQIAGQTLGTVPSSCPAPRM